MELENDEPTDRPTENESGSEEMTEPDNEVNAPNEPVIGEHFLIK